MSLIFSSGGGRLGNQLLNIFHLLAISKEYDIESRVENIRDIIRKIRKIRAELSIHPKEIINVKIYINESNLVKDIAQHSDLIDNMTNIKIEITDQKDEYIDYIDLIDENYTLYLKIRSMIDADEETAKIDKKITDLSDIVDKIDHKLNNKKFIGYNLYLKDLYIK